MAQPRRLLPSMGQLSAFESVCRTGSTLAAAADLSLTQGAVSKLIHGLEAQLGGALFLREGRSLQPPLAATGNPPDRVARLVCRSGPFRPLAARHAVRSVCAANRGCGAWPWAGACAGFHGAKGTRRGPPDALGRSGAGGGWLLSGLAQGARRQS